MYYLERITGPWHGVYVAAYTTELEGLFYGYAKLCRAKPPDVWAVQTVLKLSHRDSCTSETDALETIEARAVCAISELHSPAGRSLWGSLVARARQNG